MYRQRIAFLASTLTILLGVAPEAGADVAARVIH